MTAVYASPGATRAANRLLPGRCLENEISRALAGRRETGGRDRRRFYLGGIVVTVEPGLSPTTDRPCWFVTRVEAAAPPPGEDRMQTQSRRHQ